MLPYYTLPIINVGPLILNVWGLFAGLAFGVALYIALKEAKRKNINEDHIFDLAIIALAGGVVGARIAYVLENWDYFSQNQSEILSLKEGGLMFYGGALAVVLFVGIYIKRKKLNGWNIIDALVPSFAIGEFIGRIGCALADLHLGAITSLPWAQEYIDGSVRHPIAIYMSLNGMAMFIVFWFLRTKVKIKGALFLFFVLWYSGIRFFLDFLRCNDLEICDPMYSGYTPSQIISIGVFIITLIYLITKYKKYMAEQQKNSESNAEGKVSGNKDLQGSVVTYTEVEEVIFEENTGSSDASSSPAGGAKWKNKLKAAIKNPWILVATLFAVSILIVGLTVALVRFDDLLKNSPFMLRGKTWVSYDEPIVGLKVLNDKNCLKCDISDIVAQIKTGVIPTLSAQEVDFNSAEGKKLIQDFGIKSLPALFFDKGIEKAAIFEKIQTVMANKDDLYYLNSSASGIPPGKFLELPNISAEDRIAGSSSAEVTIIEFSDFQCPYCKEENGVLKQVMAAYPDKVRLVFKHFPLPSHPDAQYAAEAAECAGDQGKFFEMVDVLFANQEKLDIVSIAKYAKNLKLDAQKFKECADSGKFKSKIANDSQTAAEFGVGGTPAFFVGNELVGGAISLEEFKQIIDAQLVK